MKARMLLALSSLVVLAVSGCASTVSGTASPAGVVAGSGGGVTNPPTDDQDTGSLPTAGTPEVPPSDPTEPSEPARPSEPSDPVPPSEPNEPVPPSEPNEPSEPVEPSPPTAPVEPTAPTDAGGPSTGNMQACVSAGEIIQNILPLMTKIQDGSLSQADVDGAFPADKIGALPAELADPITEIRDLFTQMVGKPLTDVAPLLQEVSTKLQTLATSTLQEVCSA